MAISSGKLVFRWATAVPLMLISCPALAGERTEISIADIGGLDPAASADDEARLPSEIAVAERASDGWEVTVTPYLWFSGLSGDVGAFPAVPPVDVDISFGDVLENLDFAGMVATTVRKDRFVALADISYIDLGTSRDVGINDPSFAEIDLDTATFTATLAGGYRAVDQEELFLDVFGGMRISSVDTELELVGPARTLATDSSETWVDPVIGSRLHIPLGGNWALAAYGDVGGFGVGSDLTWQLMGTVQIPLGDNWRLAAGWRYYAIDYEKDAFIYDVSMHGPIIGVSFDL